MNEAKHILARLKNEGRRIIGCFPLYPPVELLHSFGLTPVVLWGGSYREMDLSRSDRHLQYYTCRVARNMTEFILSLEDGLLDGLFMYNACDTLRNLPEIIEAGLDGKGSKPSIFKLHIPALPEDRTMSRAYLSGRIDELISQLEGFTTKPFSSKNFLSSVELYQEQRRLCRACSEMCASGKTSFSAASYILELAHILPVEEHVAVLQKEALKAKGAADVTRDHIKVMTSGIQAPPVELMEVMEVNGLRVVANDIATMSRSYENNPVPCADPCEFYCDFYFNHKPCTTLLPASDRRVEFIKNTSKSSGAQGFIFFGEKFCEYEYFEMPYMQDMLKALGVETLLLELGADDLTNLMPHKTRIEAFAEMLKSR